MNNLEKLEINDSLQFIQNIFEIIKQTHSGSEKENSLLDFEKLIQSIIPPEYIVNLI